MAEAAPECGHPCQICANECEVQAINPLGQINQNECHYCLDCQITYCNDRKCPPLVQQRKRRERTGAPSPSPAAATPAGKLAQPEPIRSVQAPVPADKRT